MTTRQELKVKVFLKSQEKATSINTSICLPVFSIVKEISPLFVNNFFPQGSPNKVARIFCVVHLRRLLSDFVEGAHSSEWHKLSNDTHKFVKDALLEVLQKEEDGPTRRVLCDLIGELFATIKKLDDEKKNAVQDEGKQWDSLMPNVWSFLTSGNTVLMESALKILGILFVYCGKEFAEHTEELFPILKQALEHDNIRVKAGAIDAIANFIATMQTKYCKVFKDLIPLMLQSTVLIVRDNEELVSI